VPPHQIAPYYQPAYPAPRQPQARTDGRAQAALLTASIGLVLDLTAILLGATAYLFVIDGLLLGLLLGVPAMVLGAIGYFLARSSHGRIADSNGTIGGQGTATTALALGVTATAVGAVVTLIAIVLYLLAAVGLPPL
jgi:hypothetical protein